MSITEEKIQRKVNEQRRKSYEQRTAKKNKNFLT